MKRFLLFLVFLQGTAALRAQRDLKLRYDHPAQNWNEALPVGNGRLGAMIFGSVDSELMQLNEQTLWSGGPVNPNPNPSAPDYLPQVRAALAREDYEAADRLTRKLQGLYSDAYEPAGDLLISQHFPDSAVNYSRDLDISNAIAHTRFSVAGIVYTRETFVSAPDQVIVTRILSDKPGALNLTVSLRSQLFHTVSAGEGELVLKGLAPSRSSPGYVEGKELPVVYGDGDGCRGMRYQLRAAVKNRDGQVRIDSAGIQVTGATEILLLVSGATSFNGFDKCPDKDGRDENAIAAGYLQRAAAKTFDELRAAHIADYRHYFDRVSLQLGTGAGESLPTDRRLAAYTAGAQDNALEVLYFQMGRYLLISSSRPGGQAANLQGIWNHWLRPPWSCNYTTNINLEMNYWMAESANLSELHEPLIGQVQHLSVTGRATAKNFYRLDGWVTHHNSDIWALSNPVGGSPSWANWPMGSGWLCQHLWEHYQFTGDSVYLRETAYPIMKEAAKFYLGWLIEDGQGRLVTAPSTSPENEFVLAGGAHVSVSVACTMDMTIIRDLFSNLIQASRRLGIDADFAGELQEKRDKLFRPLISPRGTLQEWSRDFTESDPHHRHVSHLFGLFPGREFSPSATPRYAAAVRQSLETRGDEGTGWSKGWKINLWARLLDGDRAHKLIREQLRLTDPVKEGHGGTYPNLLDAHPPFQIDGNFGGSSGVVEMLLQSQDGAVHILPALPAAWASGRVTGLKARGGFEIVELSWQNGKITSLVIRSALGGNLRLRIAGKIFSVGGGPCRPATGTNPNPFYATEGVAWPEVSSSGGGAGNGIAEYDLVTQPGGLYRFRGTRFTKSARP